MYFNVEKCSFSVFALSLSSRFILCSGSAARSFHSIFMGYLFGFWMWIISADIDCRFINVEYDSQGDTWIT
jgi:hypothetical protein